MPLYIIGIISELLLFMPVLISVIWLITFMLIKKTYRQKVLSWALAAATVYLPAYALYMNSGDGYEEISKIEVVSLPMGLVWEVVLCLYIWVHISHKKLSIVHSLAFVPALLFASVHTTLYYIIGTDCAAEMFEYYERTGTLQQEYNDELHHLFLNVNYYWSTAIGFVTLIVQLCLCGYLTRKEGYRFGDFCRFIFKHQRSTPSRLVSLCVMVLACSFFIGIMVSIYFNDMVLRVLASDIGAIALHFMCFGEYNSGLAMFDKEHVTKRHSINALIHGVKEEDTDDEDNVDCTIDDNEGDEELDAVGEEKKIPAHRMSTNTSGLLLAFKRLMDEEQLYLDTDISIIEVANRLNIGRTTLSTTINYEYGKNFRAVINDYRIEFAKEYMLKNPSITHEQVAFKCGFKDASAFSHKFKDIVGTSPSLWMMSASKA